MSDSDCIQIIHFKKLLSVENDIDSFNEEIFQTRNFID